MGIGKLFAAAVIAGTLCQAATMTVGPAGADFTTIQEAILAASAGDTVLVKPGLYVIAEPLSFQGKAITVRGEDGPAETVVQMRETPTDPLRASVVIFENGEGPDSVLEGLTLTGGRGTHRREARRGC